MIPMQSFALHTIRQKTPSEAEQWPKGIFALYAIRQKTPSEAEQWPKGRFRVTGETTCSVLMSICDTPNLPAQRAISSHCMDMTIC